MSWWMIVLIVIIVLFFVAAVVANIELNMFLAPHGFWGRMHKFKEVSDITDIQKTEELLENKVEQWISKNSVKDLWTISFDTLRLHAQAVIQKRLSHKWVLCLHGYGGNYLTVESFGMEYFSRGYNVVMPDMRYYGKSQGRYAGMGWLDRKDAAEWIKEILKMDPDADIVVHGVSMGASAVMMLSGENLPENVKCLVADCGYTSVWNCFSHIRKDRFHLPVFPMLYIAGLFCKIRMGYFLHEASSLRQLKKCKVPVYMIHGSEDTFVPSSMIIQNYHSVLNAPKDWYILSGAAHAVSVYKNPELYWRKVFGFVDRFVK